MIIAIIMPTYNEAENIGYMIDELVGKEFSRFKEAEMHLIVVDDSSSDGTLDIVRQKMKPFSNIHILKGENNGLGSAYIKGIKYAINGINADAIMEMDADLQHDPKYVKEFVAAFQNGADYVIGSIFIPGGSIPYGWSWHRRFISYYGNLFVRLVLRLPNLHDITTGFRLTRVKGILDKIDLDNLLELKRFAYKIDLLYKTVKLSREIVELPINFKERKNEKSKFRLKEIIATFRVIVILSIKEIASVFTNNSHISF